MGLSVPFRFLSKPPRPPAGCVALVREALLPVQVWLDVPVERDVAVGLTGVERFFLEAALALRRFVAADIEEITSLPRLVVHRLAARMMSQPRPHAPTGRPARSRRTWRRRPPRRS